MSVRPTTSCSVEGGALPGTRRAAALALLGVFLVAAGTSSEPRGVMPSKHRLVSSEKDWSGQVSAFPLPGTLTASPETTISLRGTSRDRLGDFQVIGSDSGRHPGSFRGHPDGNGVTFQPDESFKPGEVVTVRTHLNMRGGREGRFRFGIARPASIKIGGGGSGRLNPDRLSQFASYQSAPDLQPPKLQVDRSGKDTGDYVFLGPKKETLQNGPMIVDGEGEPVWYQPLRGKREAWDLKVQEYRGEKVLTWWEGTSWLGFGSGELVVLDKTYREVARFKAGNGYSADPHEFTITPNGTALLIAHEPVYWDMSSVGGSGNAPAFDTVVQEVDIASGDVLFEWHSLGAVGLDESYQRIEAKGPAYDYLHPNSVNLDSDGNLLLSGRHTSTVYKIDRATGKIIWRLGGKRSDFEMGERERFGWQHDAQRQRDGTITIFDNGGNMPERKLRDYSRGIVLDLDTDAMKAELVREYRLPDAGMAFTQANVQQLPNGNVCVGWGSLPRFTEFSRDGRVIADGRLPRGVESYRAFCYPWKGEPSGRPAVDADPSGGDEDAVITYASWNGATEVAKWRVLAGPDSDKLKAVTSAPRTGFETPIVADTNAKYIAVRALDDAGKTLGTSEPVRVDSD
ncbi:MAG: hypothetical protein GEV03_11750 [Streptosporangiales bacterium]|nr:hypothetical protein [Streptosporangiales bacterium]